MMYWRRKLLEGFAFAFLFLFFSLILVSA